MIGMCVAQASEEWSSVRRCFTSSSFKVKRVEKDKRTRARSRRLMTIEKEVAKSRIENEVRDFSVSLWSTEVPSSRLLPLPSPTPLSSASS